MEKIHDAYYRGKADAIKELIDDIGEGTISLNLDWLLDKFQAAHKARIERGDVLTKTGGR